MANYSFTPTYFQITWNDRSPTDYSGLVGNQGGGLDSQTAFQIQGLIRTTGSSLVSGTPFTEGSTIIINNYTVTFTATDTLDTAITKINLISKFTGVYADQSVAGGYITLQNAPGFEGVPFYLQEGNATALATLGLNSLGKYPTGQYQNSLATVASLPYSNVTNDSTISINNVTITFTSGNIQSAVSQINNYTTLTGVEAEAAGPYIQLESSGWTQPFVINSGNALASLGFAAGVYTGPISTLTASQFKERANMRWFQAVNQLESTATPNYFGNIVRSGNIGNVALNSVTWTVGYESIHALSTQALPAEPDYPATLVGTDAIKRWVARAMTNTWTSNRKVFNPQVEQFNGHAGFDNPAILQNVTAQGIDSVANILIISNNISVTQIPGI